MIAKSCGFYLLFPYPPTPCWIELLFLAWTNSLQIKMLFIKWRTHLLKLKISSCLSLEPFSGFLRAKTKILNLDRRACMIWAPLFLSRSIWQCVFIALLTAASVGFFLLWNHAPFQLRVFAYAIPSTWTTLPLTFSPCRVPLIHQVPS